MHSSMKQAHAAPRCQYIRLNDQPCTQPALRNHVFCRFHDLVDNPLPDSRFIPFVEDAASLQVAIMQVIKSLQLGKMDRRTAGTILYALQIAASNLKYLAAETGRAYDLSSTKPTKKKEKEEEELPGPSLAETLLERLDHLLEENPPELPDRDTGVSPVTPSSEHHPLSTQHSALSTPTQKSEIGNQKYPESRSDDSPVAQHGVLGSSAPSLPSPAGTDRRAILTNNQPPTTKNDFPDAHCSTPRVPIVVDKMEACAT